MLLYSILTIATCSFAYLVVTPRMNSEIKYRSRQQTLNRICIAAIFLLLFAVSALRDMVGADYRNYTLNFNAIYYNAYVVTEEGYNFFVKAIYFLVGSLNYYYIFAAFSFATVLGFMRAIRKQSDWYFLSFFLYMTLGLYFIAFSTMRYYLVLGFALLLMKDAIDGRYIKFAISVLILSMFHKSVLLIIPIYFFARLPWKRWQLAVLAVPAAGMFIFQDLFLKIFLRLYPSYISTEYIEQTSSNLIGIMRCVATIVLAMLFYKDAIKENKANKFYLRLNYFALLVYLFGSFIPLLSRICYYMTISQILLIPSILCHIQDKKIRKLFTVLTIAAGVAYFAIFLYRADSVALNILPYKTWLFK